MRIRQSGMPEEYYWESFFDTEKILLKLKLDNTISDVVEFGSGYGTFTIPAAKIIKGNIYAFDIDSTMTNRLKQRSKLENISNIKILNKDFMKEGTGFEDNSVDYVMLFNILHTENPISLLKEIYRILSKSGKVGIIHWSCSQTTPKGPTLDIRPTPEQCIGWLKSAGFIPDSGVIQLPPYHYGMVGIKPWN